MKHLKTYSELRELSTLFESLSSENRELDYNLIEEIKDRLLPFSDIGVKVTCDYTDNGEGIIFNVMGQKEKAFDIKDYIDDIDALLSYMRENNWAIFNFNLGIVQETSDWSGHHLLARNQNILSYPNGPLYYDKVFSPVFWITGEFRKIVYTKVKGVKESTLFESIRVSGQSEGFSNQYILDDVKDILLELDDIGIECRIWTNNYRSMKTIAGVVKKPSTHLSLYRIILEISYENDDPFKQNELKGIAYDVVSRLESYFEENGGHVRCTYEAKDYTQLVITISQENKIVESNYEKTNDEIIDFIEDVFIELNDKGYSTYISKTGIDDDLKIHKPTPFFQISRYGKSGWNISIKSGFKFSDVKDEILQIKSYLGDSWIKCGVRFYGHKETYQIDINENEYDSLDQIFQTKETPIIDLIVFFNI